MLTGPILPYKLFAQMFNLVVERPLVAAGFFLLCAGFIAVFARLEHAKPKA